jgi:hypothetical protein
MKDVLEVLKQQDDDIAELLAEKQREEGLPCTALLTANLLLPVFH